MRKQQKIQILDFLRKHGSITTMQAIKNLNCLRASARIFELRNDGHEIMTFWEDQDHKRIAKYVLMKEAHEI